MKLYDALNQDSNGYAYYKGNGREPGWKPGLYITRATIPDDKTSAFNDGLILVNNDPDDGIKNHLRELDKDYWEPITPKPPKRMKLTIEFTPEEAAYMIILSREKKKLTPEEAFVVSVCGGLVDAKEEELQREKEFDLQGGTICTCNFDGLSNYKEEKDI